MNYFHQSELANLNNLHSTYFLVVENWSNLYYESPFIQKYFADLKKEKFNYITYFKYLKATCLIFINFLNIIGEIDYMKFNLDFHDNLTINNVDFIYEPNKEKAKNLLEESMRNLAQEIHENYKNDDYINYKTKILFGYYFNNDINNFVETYSGNVLYDFFINKIISLIKFIYIIRYGYSLNKKIFDKKEEKKEKKEKKNNKKNKKGKNKKEIEKKEETAKKTLILVDEIMEVQKKDDINKYLMPSICNYYDTNNILNLFDFSQYKNVITNILIKSAIKEFEPDFKYYSYEIYNYFYNIYYNYIYPTYNFNLLLSKFCWNEENLCFPIKTERYENYDCFVDFFELIKVILNTEFNKNEKLNAYFKKELIDFLLNSDNSLIYIFIHEIYNLIRKEMIYRGDKDFKIKNKFKIRVKQGFKYSSQFISKLKKENRDISSIKINNKINIEIKDNTNNIKLNKEEIKEQKEDNNNNKNITIPKKKKFKLKINSKKEDIKEKNYNNNILNDNNKNIHKNNNDIIVIKNSYKRKNVPITGYEGFLPNNAGNIGKSKIGYMKNIFTNEIIFVDKTSYQDNIKQEKKTTKKLDIFNLIFQIGSLNKDEIILNQYDISDILDINMDKNSLEKIVEQNKYIIPEIPKYWDKYLNLAFIYNKLKYNFVEK